MWGQSPGLQKYRSGGLTPLRTFAKMIHNFAKIIISARFYEV